MFYFILSVLLLFFFYFLQKRNSNTRKYLILFNLVICLVYFIWRFTVVPLNSYPQFITGCLLLLAELLGLIQFTSMQLLFTRSHVLKKKTLLDYNGSLPSIDVFICTYNESVKLLEKTILCAMNLEYEKSKLNIYVCDDGRRLEVKTLCESCHVGYITRDSNEGGKAGNINNALLHTSSELFAVLDADMLCTSKFLERTVGYFSDSKNAFVQTPQVYYNKDMYQHNLKKENIPNEQDFFMRDVQSGRAAFNAVLHVGTNAVFRRASVLEIGMYPTNSITEDMAVGMLLQAKGYHSIFINEPLVLGISVSNYTDLAIQRDRWCRGNLQVIGQFNPFFKKGLNFFQKIIYFDGFLYWFTSFQKIIYILCPIIFLMTGIRSMNADLSDLVTLFLPYFIGSILIFKSIAPDSRSLKWAHIYEIAMAPHTCASIIKELFSLEIDFRVTPKESRDDMSYFQFHVILPHLILGILTLLSWFIGYFLLQKQLLTSSSYLINMIWSIYNGVGIFICIRVAYQLTNHRTFEFSNISAANHLKLLFDDNKADISVLSLSDAGMKFKINAKSPFVGGKLPCVLLMPYQNKIVLIDGLLSSAPEPDICFFAYGSLKLDAKLALMNFYLDHLKPIYPISSMQKYEK